MKISRVFNFHINREQGLTYESIALHFFALAIVSIYIPVFLYQEYGSILPVIWFFFYDTVFHLILLLVTPKWIGKMGLKHSILFSKPFLIIAIFMFYTLDLFNWPIEVMAFFTAVYSTFFWTAYHADLAKIGEQTHFGEEVSIAWTARILSTVIGPIVGAVLLTAVGFHALFALTMVFLVASVIPLFFSNEIYEPISFSYADMLKAGHKHFAVAHIGLGIREICERMWYLLVFLVIPDYTAYGFLNTISLVFTVLGTIIVGRLIDIYDKQWLIKIGTIANTVIYIFKAFIRSGFQLFFVSIPDGFANSVIWIPMTALGYQKAREGNFMEWIVIRELSLVIGNAFVLALLILTFPFLHSNVLMLAMVIGAIGSLMMLAIEY